MAKFDPIERLPDGTLFRLTPEQPKLERAICNPKQMHRCEVCGRGFLTRSGKGKYCRECAAKVHRRQKAESARKRRSGVDK